MTFSCLKTPQFCLVTQQFQAPFYLVLEGVSSEESLAALTGDCIKVVAQGLVTANRTDLALLLSLVRLGFQVGQLHDDSAATSNSHGS